MDRLVVPTAILFALGMFQYSYLDLRIRMRGGIGWFWLMGPAPVLLWLSRAAMLASLITAILVFFFGAHERLVSVMIGFFVIHIVALEGLLLRETPP